MSASTSNWRRFSLGKRSVPPATNIARGPSSVAIRAASRAVFGRRYLNRGSRNTIQLLRRRFDLYAWGIWDGGEAGGPETWRFALSLAAQGLQHFLGRDGDLVDPDAEGVEDG